MGVLVVCYGDGVFTKLDNDPRTTGGVADPIDENTVPWCFAYGEEEWLARKVFAKVKEQTERFVLGRGRLDDINYKVECR